MRTLWQDVRYAVRQLRNAPVWAATAVLTLGLGLGAVTAMLAIVDSVLVRPIALPHAERLVDLRQLINGKPTYQFSPAEVAALEEVKAFAAVAATSGFLSPVTTRDGSRVEEITLVSPGFFSVAGIAPRLGRALTTSDVHQPVAVVNDQFFQDRLHGDPRSLGSFIKLRDRPVTVVGVMPPGFSLPQGLQGAVVYTPLVYNGKGEDEFGFSDASVAARLKPGVTADAALAEARAVHARGKSTKGHDHGELLMRPYRELLIADERPALLAVLGACVVLLLIACANAANLQIARGANRTGEMSVRAALGATRGRLARQIVTESVTVSLLGAALGLFLACAAVQWVRAAYRLQFTRFNELSVNPRVFVLCAALAVVAGALAALAPAWFAARSAGSLQGPLASRVTRRSRLSAVLVAGEIALTLALLVTAGLFIRTYNYLAHAPFGFKTHQVTGVILKPNLANESPEAQKQTEERLLARLAALPGVQSAAFEMSIPYSRYFLQLGSDFHFAGEAAPKDEIQNVNVVSPSFTRTLGLGVLRGRPLLASDAAGAQPVCLVTDAFVRRFAHGANPVGRTIVAGEDDRTKRDAFYETPRTIVGVVADEVAGSPVAVVYVPASQFPPDASISRFVFGFSQQFLIKSPLPQPAIQREIRAAVREAAPSLAEADISPLRNNIEQAFVRQRLALRLASSFGLLALVLAAVGIYGVLASTVAQRTREIGIRIALGASRRQAVGLVLRQAAAMVAAGLALGLGCAWPAGRVVRAFLSGVTPLDPLTLVSASLALLLVCACAALIPAWRAALVDPVIALRSE